MNSDSNKLHNAAAEVVAAFHRWQMLNAEAQAASGVAPNTDAPYVLECSEQGYAEGISRGGYWLIHLNRGTVRNEENAQSIVDRLNAAAPLRDFCPHCGASIPHRKGEGRCERCMEHLPKDERADLPPKPQKTEWRDGEGNAYVLTGECPQLNTVPADTPYVLQHLEGMSMSTDEDAASCVGRYWTLTPVTPWKPTEEWLLEHGWVLDEGEQPRVPQGEPNYYEIAGTGMVVEGGIWSPDLYHGYRYVLARRKAAAPCVDEPAPPCPKCGRSDAMVTKRVKLYKHPAYNQWGWDRDGCFVPWDTERRWRLT